MTHDIEQVASLIAEILKDELLLSNCIIAKCNGGVAGQSVTVNIGANIVTAIAVNSFPPGDCLLLKDDSSAQWYAVGTSSKIVSQSTITYRRGNYVSTAEDKSYFIKTFFSRLADLYIGGYTNVKKLITLTCESGYITNLGGKQYLIAVRYIQSGLRKYLFKTLSSEILLTNTITSGNEYFLGNSFWESNSGVPQRAMIHDSSLQFYPVTETSTIIKDAYFRALTLTAISNSAQTWVPSGTGSFTYTRVLTGVVYETVENQPPDSPHIPLPTTSGIYIFISSGSRRVKYSVNNEETITYEAHQWDYTLLLADYPAGVGFPASSGRVQLTFTGYSTGSFPTPPSPPTTTITFYSLFNDIDGDRYDVVAVVGDGITGVRTVTGMACFGYQAALDFAANSGRNRTWSDLTVSGDNYTLDEGSITWTIYEVNAPIVTPQPPIPPNPERIPDVLEENYLENYIGNFVAQQTVDAYILQNLHITNTIHIDHSAGTTEDFAETNNQLIYKSPDHEIDLNNNNFLAINQYDSLTAINLTSSSFAMSVAASYSGFSVSANIGMPFLFNYAIAGVPCLIKGTIVSGSYISGVLQISCSISEIKQKVLTSFLNKLITNNGSFYGYYFRNQLPSGFRFLNKSILKVIALNPIVSTFLSVDYTEQLNDFYSQNFKTDTMLSNNIYSVVNTNNMIATVEQWSLDTATGDLSFMRVFKTPYYPIGNSSTIFGHSFNPN